MTKQNHKQLALHEVMDELERAMAAYSPFDSPRDGFGEIDDKLTDLREVIRQDDTDMAAMRKEAMQVAAMALRFMVELT